MVPVGAGAAVLCSHSAGRAPWQGGVGRRNPLGQNPRVVSSGTTLENKFKTRKSLHVGKAEEGVILRVIAALQKPYEKQR